MWWKPDPSWMNSTKKWASRQDQHCPTGEKRFLGYPCFSQPWPADWPELQVSDRTTMNGAILTKLSWWLFAHTERGIIGNDHRNICSWRMTLDKNSLPILSSLSPGLSHPSGWVNKAVQLRGLASSISASKNKLHPNICKSGSVYKKRRRTQVPVNLCPLTALKCARAHTRAHTHTHTYTCNSFALAARCVCVGVQWVYVDVSVFVSVCSCSGLSLWHMLSIIYIYIYPHVAKASWAIWVDRLPRSPVLCMASPATEPHSENIEV